MAKVGRKLAIWLYMGIKRAGRSKKLLRNILSLAESDNKRIATGFYRKKQGYGKKIKLHQNSKVYWSYS